MGIATSPGATTFSVIPAAATLRSRPPAAPSERSPASRRHTPTPRARRRQRGDGSFLLTRQEFLCQLGVHLAQERDGGNHRGVPFG